MHENRETSETAAAQPGRRSAGEGLSHKARAYVYEESHNGIVPMNHSNKDGKVSAESGEGRPLIKENAGQPNTYPTQSGKGVSQGLAGVRKAAKANKEMKFTALLHHLTVDLLRESFYSLQHGIISPGAETVARSMFQHLRTLVQSQPVPPAMPKLLDTRHPTNTRAQLCAKQPGVRRLVGQSPNRSELLIDCVGSQPSSFQEHSVANHHDAIEG